MQSIGGEEWGQIHLKNLGLDGNIILKSIRNKVGGHELAQSFYNEDS